MRELEVRCSSLERSIQLLKRDVDWTYSAPDVPRSHWIEQGHDEEYAANVEGCLERIKGDVGDIRDGDEYYYCGCLGYEDQLAIMHDDALLPHFKELTDAIQLSNRIGQIDIDNMEMCPSALRILFPAMEGKAQSLKELRWDSNQIPSDEQADLLIDSVIDNWSIKNVTLRGCFGQEGVNGFRALATIMTCGRPFQTLDFGGNGLSGIDDVTAALATNPQLEILDLARNQLNDSDAELIAQALKQNTNLQELHLYDNSITSAGFEKIRTAIYDPSSLNAMESCNHTCWVDCVEQNDHCREGNFSGMTSQQRRRRKFYELFSARHVDGSNARHLNAELGEGAFTTKLVPRVLECIGQCSVDRSTDAPPPLSLYFELMRGWKMPELHGNQEITTSNDFFKLRRQLKRPIMQVEERLLVSLLMALPWIWPPSSWCHRHGWSSSLALEAISLFDFAHSETRASGEAVESFRQRDTMGT
ncbi:hypothetical protein THAOC_11618 [Thalassiosira oceanica]|uniref:Uncharacterized protein n=1 Tax=Thalassiosira oceanica TaxID=159749 RepID=K0SQS0_THAOC|nr:hypothetical protein THAOC_11618 [Thalassiosira oceanica]|eukprot:EJK67359.1 hypothetical protein THAOC_11618 [Thalassiosira oceanica]